MPLESSVEGAVPLTQDELTHGEPLLITAEAYVPITFDLLVRPGTDLAAIRTVGAHPHGHAQIRAWLAENLPAAEAVMSASNAAAAAAVAAGDLDAAAAAPVAGPRYGLVTLAADIGEVRDAVTRFVLLRPTGRTATADRQRPNLPGAVRRQPSGLAARGADRVRRPRDQPDQAGIPADPQRRWASTSSWSTPTATWPNRRWPMWWRR